MRYAFDGNEHKKEIPNISYTTSKWAVWTVQQRLLCYATSACETLRSSKKTILLILKSLDRSFFL